jgi:hypothetical protein
MLGIILCLHHLLCYKLSLVLSSFTADLVSGALRLETQ